MFVKQKRAFSFLEMLIVIMIISILFVAFRGSFQVKNKDVLYGQACIETLYGQVNNFLHAGLSSKSVFSWNTAIFPDQYIAKFIPDQQKILLTYEINELPYPYQELLVTGSTTTYCKSNSYEIFMTWTTYEVHINKWLQENQALQSFYITGGTSVSTGETTFIQCTSQWSGCKTMARFETDTRTISLKKYMCLSFTETGECIQWDN